MLKKILMTGTVLLGISAVAVTAAKAQSSRLYFAGYMGLNTSTDHEFSETSTPARGDFEFKNTPSFAGALGLRIDNSWRVEAEISYSNPDLNSVDFANGNTFPMGGDLTTYLFMMNAYYDFDMQWKSLTPFVTAGVGLAYHDAQINDSSGFTTNASGTDVGFAYQVGGGLKYRMSDDLALSGAYRYLGGTDINIDSYSINYSGHEFRFGLEYDLPVDFLQ